MAARSWPSPAIMTWNNGRPSGMFLEGWLAWRGGDREHALPGMRRGAKQLESKQIVAHTGAIKAALAEADAECGHIEAALAAIDGAIAESERTGQRWFDAEFHRTRGEILFKRDASEERRVGK